MGIAERVAPRKTFALHMAVFDEKLLVLETDVLVFFDPVFASGADRIVDVENPDHFSFVSFHSFSSSVIPAQFDSFVFLPLASASGMCRAWIRLTWFFCRTSKTDASPRKGAAAFDFLALVTPADLIDLLMTFRAFHTHFLFSSYEMESNPFPLEFLFYLSTDHFPVIPKAQSMT